jgi:hypothetical protein
MNKICIFKKGEKSENGRGADIVIRNFADLMPLLLHFNQWALTAEACAVFDKVSLKDGKLLSQLKGQYWV